MEKVKKKMIKSGKFWIVVTSTIMLICINNNVLASEIDDNKSNNTILASELGSNTLEESLSNNNEYSELRNPHNSLNSTKETVNVDQVNNNLAETKSSIESPAKVDQVNNNLAETKSSIESPVKIEKNIHNLDSNLSTLSEQDKEDLITYFKEFKNPSAITYDSNYKFPAWTDKLLKDKNIKSINFIDVGTILEDSDYELADGLVLPYLINKKPDDSQGLEVTRITKSISENSEKFIRQIDNFDKVAYSKLDKILHEFYIVSKNNDGEYVVDSVYKFKGDGSANFDSLSESLSDARKLFQPKITYNNNNIVSFLTAGVRGHGYNIYSLDYTNAWSFHSLKNNKRIVLKDITDDVLSIESYIKAAAVYSNIPLLYSNLSDNPVEFARTKSIQGNIEKIKSGDYSSVRGTWKNGYGKSFSFSKNGLIGDYITKPSKINDNYIRAEIAVKNSPVGHFFVEFIPAGKDFSDINFVDKSDKTRDRLIIGQYNSISDPKSIFYKTLPVRKLSDEYSEILITGAGIFIMTGGVGGVGGNQNAIALRIPDELLNEEYRMLYKNNYKKNFVKKIYDETFNPGNDSNIKNIIEPIDEYTKKHRFDKEKKELKKEISNSIAKAKSVKEVGKRVVGIDTIEDARDDIGDSLKKLEKNSTNKYPSNILKNVIPTAKTVIAIKDVLDLTKDATSLLSDVISGDITGSRVKHDEDDTDFVKDVKDYKAEYKNDRESETFLGITFGLIHKIFNALVDILSDIGSSIAKLFGMSLGILGSVIAGIVTTGVVTIAGGILWSTVLKKMVMDALKNSRDTIMKFLKGLTDIFKNIKH